MGVENTLNLHPIPGQPSFVEGVADVRGQMTPAISVGRFFNLPPKSEGTALIIGSDFGQVAYITDGVEAIREIDFNNNNEAPLIIRNFAGCVKNMTLVDGKPVIFMDLPTIIPEVQKEQLKNFIKQIEDSAKKDEEAKKAEAAAADTEN